MGYLHNAAELYVDEILSGRSEIDTLVCCWDVPDPVIYVDRSAADGFNTGMSWQHAYPDLNDALTRAADSNCLDAYTIYVAQGTYVPGENADNSFILPDNVKVYGGFPSGGSPFALRNPKQYPTILTGIIPENE